MRNLLATILKITALSIACVMANAAPANTGSNWVHHTGGDRLGRIYYYERSNLDGSMGERITVFRKSVDYIEVYKENGLCQRAALVSAVLDLDTMSATRITGGSLQPDARHHDFAFLELSPDQKQISMLVQLPDMEIRNESEVLSMPWVLFDFDLASLTVTTPHISSRKDGFSFGMVLLWADPNVADPFYWMGDVQASYRGDEERLGVPTEHYRLTGSAFTDQRSTGSEGDLWLDTVDGHIVEAIFPVPNHPGYQDFRLKLLKVSDGGIKEWIALLKAHFQDCS